LANGNGVAKPATEGKMAKFSQYILSCFRRKAKNDVALEKAKELATTGKIMNLMRFVEYAGTLNILSSKF